MINNKYVTDVIEQASSKRQGLGVVSFMVTTSESGTVSVTASKSVTVSFVPPNFHVDSRVDALLTRDTFTLSRISFK